MKKPEKWIFNGKTKSTKMKSNLLHLRHFLSKWIVKATFFPVNFQFFQLLFDLSVCQNLLFWQSIHLMASWLTSVMKNDWSKTISHVFYVQVITRKCARNHIRFIAPRLRYHLCSYEQNHTDNIASELLPIILILSHCLVYWAL